MRTLQGDTLRLNLVFQKRGSYCTGCSIPEYDARRRPLEQVGHDQSKSITPRILLQGTE